ncbi:MAG: recombinase, partial [Rhodocyclales bacterium]|nr:recombinase [Rhodocyclales bacterium]
MKALHPLLEDIAARSSRSDASRTDPVPLVELVHCLRPQRGDADIDAQGRIRILIDVLRSRPQLATGLRDYLSAILAARNHFFVYAESGILGNTGFFTELSHRIANRLLPPALDARFL